MELYRILNQKELEKLKSTNEIINYIKDLGYNIKSIIINNKDLLSYDIEDVKKIIYGE